MAKVSAYSKATWTFMVILVMQICFGAGGIEVQTRRIPDAEMDALREIAEQVGKNDWDFSLNHCDENLNWHTAVVDGTYNSTVNCTCPSDEECHIMAIYLKGQDLSGVLPRSLAKLPYLKIIDFTRNYLGGPIPAEWASMKLEYMSLIVNRLSGTIPGYLGRITSLTYLNLESNMFNGTVPAELGNLVNLVYLNLNSNNLTGNLPKELSNLTKLTTLKFGSNNFTGKLPSFQSWKQLQRLELEASGFEGPIPSSISLLHNLTGLRISDLNGGASKFPQLGEMINMTRLVLRNCHISDSIPENLVNLPLTEMDVSYNKLQGNIPNLENAINLMHMFLTRNLLNGPIPTWIMKRNNAFEIDLSYNNFSDSINELPTCSYSLNLFRSFFSEANSKNCVQNIPCPENRYSLYINCGGDEAIVGNIKFEADQDKGGSAKFKQVKPYWGFSSSGYFLSNHKTWDDYSTKNVSILSMNYSLLYRRDVRMSSSQLYTGSVRMNHSQADAMNFSQLYTSARISPLSFTYYGRCLANGNYTVTLHFAEIIFRDNQSFRSLGRRIFDVYIQDKLVCKDFDIRTIAQGVDKAVLLQFDDIVVEDKTIEVRFYWAGKGTTLTPTEGTYGSLISAISIKYKFKPRSNQSKKILAAVGVSAFAFTILFVFWWKCFWGKTSPMEQDLRRLDLQTGLFTFRQIKAATNNFDDSNKIGEGGFGSVYKGILLDGTVIAVKQLSSKSNQGNREFVNEIGMISGLQHPNLVRLYGCCIEGKQLLLVYEYMENNSLARAFFDPEEGQLNLDWPTRLRICIGIARGLAFLHEESPLKIVHRDIKATNVLLDGDLNPKISDFGLAKLVEDENTHISTTRIAGTIGYMAPEYALWGYLTNKADVYSFGVLALEIFAGKSNMRYQPNEDYVCLLDWALVLQHKGCLMELVDQKMGSDFNKEEAIRMIKVALLCTNPSPALRPVMSSVLGMLEGHLGVQEMVLEPNIFGEDFRFKALRDKYNELQLHHGSSDSQSLIDYAQNGLTSTSGSSKSQNVDSL